MSDRMGPKNKKDVKKWRKSEEKKQKMIAQAFRREKRGSE